MRNLLQYKKTVMFVTIVTIYYLFCVIEYFVDRQINLAPKVFYFCLFLWVFYLVRKWRQAINLGKRASLTRLLIVPDRIR